MIIIIIILIIINNSQFSQKFLWTHRILTKFLGDNRFLFFPLIIFLPFPSCNETWSQISEKHQHRTEDHKENSWNRWAKAGKRSGFRKTSRQRGDHWERIGCWRCRQSSSCWSPSVQRRSRRWCRCLGSPTRLSRWPECRCDALWRSGLPARSNRGLHLGNWTSKKWFEWVKNWFRFIINTRVSLSPWKYK